MKKNRWIDISVPIQDGMVHWPGDPAVRIKKVLDMERGDACNVSKLSMGSHTGTHMDAPFHFFRKGSGLDRMPLDATLGPARVIEIRGVESINPMDLKPYRIHVGERILLKTQNSNRVWSQGAFVKDFVYLATESARYLAKRRVKMVGIDYLSVGGYREQNGLEVHRTLLRAGIWIIEGLDLKDVRPGKCELICLPLKIVRSDGAPARAILKQA